MKLESLKRKAAKLPKKPGVYVMTGVGGKEIYVGKAGDLRERIKWYCQDPAKLDEKTRVLLAAARDVKYIETSSEVEALVLESRMIKDLQPKYNVRLKANEQYALVEMPWKEDFPRPDVTREKGHAGSKYYGPFVDVSGLREALKILRRIFPYRTCSLVIREDDRKRRYRRPCLNHHIGLCTAPCAARVSKKDYRADLARLGLFLRGRKDELLGKLGDEMTRAAAKLRFEEAARLRDEIAAVESLDRRGRLGDGLEPAPPAIDPRDAVGKLGALLGREGPARTIEGIDLANLGGKDAVGSVVTFAEGAPARGGYRRFRIRGEATRDDYAMMREVVRRRYSRLKREKAPVPDVILVDGGLGHLKAAAPILEKLGLIRGTVRRRGDASPTGPTLAAISKSPDTPGRRRTRGQSGAGRRPDVVRTLAHPGGVKFPRGSPALRLLMFVRDEAHRFAQHYHHIRRGKSSLETG